MTVEDLKKYNLAKALAEFKKSYEHLVECSKQLPELDVSENYPFYLLDFEAIQPGVSAWCITQYDKLISGLPVEAPSPAKKEVDINDNRTDEGTS